MALRIVFDDPDLLVIEKPPGMHSVAIGESNSNSVADWLMNLFPDQVSVAERDGDAGLIQRLDFDTSGLLIAARSRSVWEKLRGMLQRSEISKIYLAVVDGLPKLHRFSDHTLLGSRHRGSKKVSIVPLDRSPLPRMLEARTAFSRLAVNEKLVVSLLEATAPVARRHQIRAHAASLGHPLTGDVLYGSQRSLVELGVRGREFFLLAHCISLNHPTTGEPLRFKCVIPREVISLFPDCGLDGSPS